MSLVRAGNLRYPKDVREVYRRLQDSDLRFLLSATGVSGDTADLLRSLRDDPEIVSGMVRDQRIVDRLMNDPEAPVRVSPRLLFAVLLDKVIRDLGIHGVTYENEGRYRTVVLDGPEVVDLVSDPDVADYLVEMLVSFVKVRNYTVTARVRKGVWRRYRYSDLDLGSLIRHTDLLEEELRFPSYKRIGDLCLFLLGVFPEAVERDARRSRRHADRPAYIEYGTRFYRAAAEHVAARGTATGRLLQRLSEHFVLATKPLGHMTGRYLDGFKHGLFGE